ncbi:MAG TPA: type II secretion system F family protein [Gaiellales bacterium]|nr:type II secretion system F family protein [Gaiellales bacterium]
MRLRHALGVTLAIAATLAPVAMAADTAASPQVGGIRKVDGHTVRVIVRAPGDLTGLDVQAELGGKTAQVTRLQHMGQRRSLHLVFAVDTSTSMAGPPLAAAIAAGQRLLDAAGSTDEVGLVVFDDSARTVTPLTGNVQAVQAALTTLTTHQGTALYDGIGDAARLTGPADGSRRVVVVLSDGDDTSSATSLDHLTASLAGGGVEVDAVGLTSSGSYTAASLRRVAAATHGSYVPASTLSALEPIAARLAQARLASEWAVDVALPHSSARTLTISLHDGPPVHVALPADVAGAPRSMWSEYGAWIVAVLGFAAIMMLATVIMSAAERRPQALTARLSPYSSELSKEAEKSHQPALTDMYEELETRLGKTSAWQWLHSLAERAGSTVPTGQIVTIIAATALLPAAFGLVTAGPLLAVPLLLCGALPVLVLRFRARRRSTAFETQLPELLSVWASALRAGRSFAQALDTLVEEAAEPALGEFRRAQSQVRLGVPIEQALDDMSKRLTSESFELVVLTTDVQRRIGGNVAEIFDQVADTVRKRQQFRARVRALVATGVMSARVLLGMPFALAAILTMINPGYMSPLYETGAGRVLIVAALVMMTAGAVVLRRMVKPRASA